MTAHDHAALVPGCARCELSVDEAIAAATATSEPDRLAQIEARLASATPGPWVPGYDAGWTVDEAAYPDGREIAAMTDQEADQGRADAEFIAHAPEDIAALLAVVKAMRTKAEGWAAKAPDDDWGEDIAQTIVADAGRSILATLDAALSEPEQL